MAEEIETPTENKTEVEEQEVAALIYVAPSSPFAVGNLEFDVLVKSEVHYSVDVTENPVEYGYVIADHTIQKPFKLSITAVVSPIPVTWYDYFGGANIERIASALDELKRLYKEKDVIELIITHQDYYENMVLTDITIPLDETSNMVTVNLEFTHVEFVETELTDIPEDYVAALDAGKAGMSKQEAGAAGTSDVSAATGSTTGEQTQDAMNNTEEGKWESDLHKWFGKK